MRHILILAVIFGAALLCVLANAPGDDATGAESSESASPGRMISIFWDQSCDSQEAHDGTIKVFADDSLYPVLSRINDKLYRYGIGFAAVDTPAQSDVSIGFSDNLPGDARSYAYRGHIDVDSNPAGSLDQIVLHEIIHTGGGGHNPGNPRAVMYTHSTGGTELSDVDIAALRRLPGISPLGRVGAQVRQLFDQ